MGKLVIVESPAKARTITRILGDDYQVLASMGHIRDLPEKQLGIQIKDNFTPIYEISQSRKKMVTELTRAAKKADHVYLATDPDREGEAISWHLQEVLKEQVGEDAFQRVTFHEITAAAVKKAFDSAHKLNMNLVDAQQARRILDRLVGYKVSPLLWRQIRNASSAGRVQSVALRLICEREQEVQEFKPREYWNFLADFASGPEKDAPVFSAKLHRIDDEAVDVPSLEKAEALAGDAAHGKYQVKTISRTPRQRRPPPPFITSTMQQAASANLRMSPEQTMRVAQELYEGVDADTGGLITYMRTDSVNISKEAQAAARSYISAKFGEDYLPKKPNVYRSKKSAQEAHEAIRPTSIELTPEKAAAFLSERQLRLYRLIWRRFIACQMAPVKQLVHAIELTPEAGSTKHQFLFRASATQVVFPGFLQVYSLKDVETDEDENGEQEISLPKLTQGQGCPLVKLAKEQKFTEPPPFYSEAMLVRELESNGIGRPSTYASIIKTIQTRKYVTKTKGKLHASELGIEVTQFLVRMMPKLMAVEFTAAMEDQLDKVEQGELGWREMLAKFYEEFAQWLYTAKFGTGPEIADALQLIKLFPDDLKWLKPERLHGRAYNDQKFFTSLKTQLEAGKKLSEKQWEALLRLAVRYEDQLSGLQSLAEELGVESIVEEARRRRDQAATPDEQEPALLRMSDALDNVTEWMTPVKRGARIFDDEKFAKSLISQVRAGRILSEAQKRALRNLVVKYHQQIPEFAALSEELELPPPEDVSTQSENLKRLFALVDEIKEWERPRGQGKRQFSDEKFVRSLKGQFAQSASLSERQTAALAKLVGKYRKQIPNFDERSAGLNIPETKSARIAGKKAKAEVVTTDVDCPQCGKGKLVQRKGRGGTTFYGCECFPKCRYTSKTLDEVATTDAPEE